MPYVSRTFERAEKRDVQPTERAPLASPNLKIPEPTLPAIPELPMTLLPAAPEQRPQVPKIARPKRTTASKRPGIARISVHKWDKSPDEIADYLGLE